MALSQSLQQKQLQKLSPQQIQLMKLLQIPTANLEQRIKDEIEENPALELGNDNPDDDIYNESTDNQENDYEEMDGSEEQYENIDISDYVHDGDDEIADYRTRDDNYGAEEEKQSFSFRQEESFQELLMEQLGLLNLSEHQHVVAEQIIGSIDDDGLLRRDTESIVDDLAFRQNIITSDEEVDHLVKLIQQFDPPGVCARDLQECLLLQLYRQRSPKNPIIDIAIDILKDYFIEFTKKHYEKILRGLNINEDQLKDATTTIAHLNPKPGGAIEGVNKAESYIIPDFYIYNNNNELELTLNGRNAPELHVNEGYREMLKQYDSNSKKNRQDKDAVMFIKQKLDSAKWFIDMIKQRQQTLWNTMNAIMNYQKEFFLTGDETNLKPMILKDISEVTGLDISTVSRVANSKFVQTEFGNYRLKFFFSESLSTDSGEEVSTREVKRILSDIIGEEDKRKPLSDERLTTMLQEKGYNIARRTVAKYREQLNIPIARLRKAL